MKRTGIASGVARRRKMIINLFNISFAIFCVTSGCCQTVRAQDMLSLHVDGSTLENAVPKHIEGGRVVISHKAGIGTFDLGLFPDGEQTLILKYLNMPTNQVAQIMQNEKLRLRKIAEKQVESVKQQEEMADSQRKQAEQTVAYDKQQQEKGLVKVNGKWLTKTQALVESGKALLNPVRNQTISLQYQRQQEAILYFKQAADLGEALGQYQLGVCYQVGIGVTANKATAVAWYRKAAEQGLAEAQFMLGLCYEDGFGVPEDNAEAIKWLRKAAEQGNSDARNKLAISYDHAKEIIIDKDAATQCRKEAEQGDAKAQLKLARCYDFGRGVIKDKDEAVNWYRKAFEQGDKEAEQALTDIIRKTYGNGAYLYRTENEALASANEYNDAERKGIDARMAKMKLWAGYSLVGAPNPGRAVTFHNARVTYDAKLGYWVRYLEDLPPF